MKRKLKNIVVASVLLTSGLTATTAFADSSEQTIEAGVTQDSFLYTFDRLFEGMQLAFTFDSEKESKLLMDFAQERLSEAKVMTKESKQEYVKEAINDYLDTLKNAQELVGTVVSDENTADSVKDELSSQLDDTTKVDDDIQNQLDDKTKEELASKTEEANLVPNIVKDLDQETVNKLRDQDFGYGEISKISVLANASGKSVDEITKMLKDGKDFGELKKELNLDNNVFAKKLVEKKKEKSEKKLEERKDIKSEIKNKAEQELKNERDGLKQKVESGEINKEEAKTEFKKKQEKLKEKTKAEIEKRQELEYKQKEERERIEKRKREERINKERKAEVQKKNQELEQRYLKERREKEEKARKMRIEQEKRKQTEHKIKEHNENREEVQK